MKLRHGSVLFLFAFLRIPALYGAPWHATGSGRIIEDTALAIGELPHSGTGGAPATERGPAVQGGTAKVVDYPGGEVNTTMSTCWSRPRMGIRSGRPPGYSASISG